MAFETDIKMFKKDKARVSGIKNSGYVYNRDEAYQLITDKLPEYTLKNNLELLKGNGDKEQLRKIKEQYRSVVTSLVYELDLAVRDMNTIEFVDYSVEEMAGYSILSHAFKDDEVSDIFCNAWNDIYIQKKGKDVKYPYSFRNPDHFKAFVARILRADNKEINKGTEKIVDSTYFGDRINAINEPIAAKGIALTIRKHSEDHIKLKQIIDSKVMSQEYADFVGMLLIGEVNLGVAGITGSGKTTTLRGLIDEYIARSGKRLLVAEDTQELFPESPNNLQLVSFKSDNKNEEVDLQQIIYTALRLKPKVIAVGEIRGPEMLAAVDAADTGHSTLFTTHAGNPVGMVNRIVTKYLQAMPSLGVEVVERIIGNSIDYVLVQDDVPGIGRKATSLTEIYYDYEKKTIGFKTIYQFDFKTHEFVRKNKISPEKADKLLRRGIPFEQLQPYVEGWENDAA